MLAASVLNPSPACTQRWRLQPYRETLTLRDGRRVLLRPAHHSDAAALALFFAALSPRARLLRFHGAVNRLPDRVLQSMTTQVPASHIALVALATTDDGLRQVLAEARYAIDKSGDEGHAEFAVAVADAWQRQGLGRALVQRLAVHARASGLQRLHGSVLPGNEPMLQLMAGLGAGLHDDGAVVEARLAL